MGMTAAAEDAAALVAFVTARHDDQATAILRDWDSDGVARVAVMWTGEPPGYTTVAIDRADGEWIADSRHVTDARHVHVLFDPQHALARVDADRHTLALHTPTPANPDRCRVCAAIHEGQGARFLAPCPTLRAMASGYDWHPDYQPDRWALT